MSGATTYYHTFNLRQVELGRLGIVLPPPIDGSPAPIIGARIVVHYIENKDGQTVNVPYMGVVEKVLQRYRSIPYILSPYVSLHVPKPLAGDLRVRRHGYACELRSW